MKNTNCLAIAMLATGATVGLGVRALPLQAQQADAPVAAAKPAAKATVDPQALALLKQVEASYKALKSYSGSVTTEEAQPGGALRSSSGTIRWLKPNRFALNQSDGKKSTAIISNGTALFVSLSSDKARYLKQPAPTGSDNITSALRQSGDTPLLLAYALSGASLIELFEIGTSKTPTSLEVGETSTVGETPVDVVNMTMSDPRFTTLYSFALGQEDHLLRQMKVSIKSTQAPAGEKEAQAQVGGFTETHSNIQLNPSLPASTFAFTPPKGAKPVDSLEPPTYDAKLKKGAAPIVFTAKDTSGKPLSLAQFKGKVVLLDFWATWCGPCVGEVPNIVAAHKKYGAKGFEVVGISLDQDRKSLDAFVKQYKMPWRQVFDGQGWKSRVPGLYGVRAIPFAVLIGRDGKIAALDVRGEALEPAIKAALAKK